MRTRTNVKAGSVDHADISITKNTDKAS